MPVVPAHLWNPASVRLSLTSRTVASPASISGVTQVLRTDGGGLWQVGYDGIVLRTTDQRRSWDAWDSYLAGGVERVKVPLLSNRDAPRGIQAGRAARYGGLVVNGDPWFPDDVQYAMPLVIATAGAAPLRATTLSISVERGSTPVGVFSIRYGDGSDRAHRIVRNLGNGQFSIDPPLRGAIEDDTPLNFDWPMADAIAVPGNDFSAEYSNGRGEVSIAFQEAF